jgi:hypothetical protein
MIAARKQARSVERPEIGDLFHHAKRLRIAPWIEADRARIGGVHIAAGGTGGQRFAHRLQRGEERQQRALTLLHQMQNRAPRRSRAQTGQPGQRLCQRFDFLRCHD